MERKYRLYLAGTAREVFAEIALLAQLERYKIGPRHTIAVGFSAN